jgi:hypothetical protein
MGTLPASEWRPPGHQNALQTAVTECFAVGIPNMLGVSELWSTHP